MRKVIVNIARLVLAIVLILSGFVKAVDPLGTQYKIADYLEVLHLGQYVPDIMTLSAAIILSAIEFGLGICLLFAIRRRLERGTACVKAKLPALVTVTSAAADCRFPNAHRMLRQAKEEVRMINADSIDADMERLGLKGSPTKVKKIENVVLAHKESVVLQPTEAALNELSATLIKEHIL